MGENRFNQNIMDAMAIISFIIGLANYNENIGQTDLQEIVNVAIDDIHRHLQIQDNKIDMILEMLGRYDNEL